MKSLTVFLRSLLYETGSWCCVSTTNDYNTIVSRIEEEGESFLTITLPGFAKDLERGLAAGYVDSSFFVGFSHKGVIPRFLGGMLSQIFDPISGVLLDDPSIAAIRGVRQICLVFSKIKRPCSDERVSAAFTSFVKCETEVIASDERMRSFEYADKIDSFKRAAHLLFDDVFSNLDNSIYWGRQAPTGAFGPKVVPLLPKHGPGTTAERILGNKKYDLHEWTTRLEDQFPLGEFGFSNWTSLLEKSDQITYREPEDELPVRVIEVPKTQKTPRIIAVEPVCMQYVQQAIHVRLNELLDEDDLLSSFINGPDQGLNQHLAMLGSLDGSLATLDLSEASDRVSYRHVRRMFERHPNLKAGIDACRSRKADVPGYGVIPLAKFASMGSALCFPIEAMVFLSLVFCAIAEESNTQLTRGLIKSYVGKVRVYGDDIIVPSRYALSVINWLEDFGLKVNRHKSFWTGLFRESCGKEYYQGHDVTLARVRSDLPSSRKDASAIVSWVSLRNQLFERGYESTVEEIDHMVEGFIPFPYVGRNSALLGRWSWSDSLVTSTHWDQDLQRPLVRGAVISTKIPYNRVDSWPALMKYFLTHRTELLSEESNGDDRSLPTADRKHLTHSGRPVSVDIKTRLMPPN